MEEEIAALQECLEAPGMPGMKGTLIDKDGFPRNDVDIPQIRSMRGRISILQTDLSKVMAEMERGLHTLHALYKDKGMAEVD